MPKSQHKKLSQKACNQDFSPEDRYYHALQFQ